MVVCYNKVELSKIGIFYMHAGGLDVANPFLLALFVLTCDFSLDN